MTRNKKARTEAGQESHCAGDSTALLPFRHRVELSAQVACTFHVSPQARRIDIVWHGDPSHCRKLRGLELARYRRARFRLPPCRPRGSKRSGSGGTRRP